MLLDRLCNFVVLLSGRIHVGDLGKFLFGYSKLFESLGKVGLSREKIAVGKKRVVAVFFQDGRDGALGNLFVELSDVLDDLLAVKREGKGAADVEVIKGKFLGVEHNNRGAANRLMLGRNQTP